MNSTLWPAILGALGVVISFFTATALARRQFSGKIATTDADRLWDASEAIRHDLTDYVKAQTARMVVLEAELATLRAENASLRARLDRMEGGGA